VASVHQLKVVIIGTKPPAWRRVVVPSRITLGDLHEVLQATFGWWNYHLHDFEIDGVRYGVDDDDEWSPTADEHQARLDQLAPQGSSFIYTYDFGDNWEHKIVVEKVAPADPTVAYPVCTGGRRACPPEDCGGVWGYQHLLEILADPSHEEHESMLEWVGGPFDSAAFNPADIADQFRVGALAER